MSLDKAVKEGWTDPIGEDGGSVTEKKGKYVNIRKKKKEKQLLFTHILFLSVTRM